MGGHVVIFNQYYFVPEPGDVDGSVEAILDVLETYDNTDVPLSIVHYGVGDTTPSDVEMASVFNGMYSPFAVIYQWIMTRAYVCT